MEWKKSKSIKLKAKPHKCKLGFNMTLNSIPTQKGKEKTHHHKVLTQGGQAGYQSQCYSGMFGHDLKENHVKGEEECSTFANSLHSLHYHHTLSKQLTQIGLQFQHQNERIKTFLNYIPKKTNHKQPTSALHTPKPSLSAKIKYQAFLLKSMTSLRPYR